MLYLNWVGLAYIALVPYLTLTSVVFEFYSNLSNSLNTGYLTLTSVVFELESESYTWQGV